MTLRVMAAMSGGVDSSAAAYLLREAGHEVVGLTMCLGVTPEGGTERKCCSPDDVEDARRVCRHLGIPHYVHDFSSEMEDLVISDFTEEYARGRTPNPCVRCNRYLKFGALLDRARSLGFDALATGHYVRVVDNGGRRELHRARDIAKDQSYFLYAIGAENLGSLIFPLSDYVKNEVRDIARRAGLPVASKHESQDICFIPEGGSESFFRARGIESRPGQIVDSRGAVIGSHRGYMLYTIGQRRGLGIGGTGALYVTGIDAAGNRITAGGRDELGSRGLVAGSVRLFDETVPARATVKIRYAGPDVPCSVKHDDDALEIIFDEPAEAVTPGQSAVLYDGSRVIGGGIIEKVIH